jgi:hypothetical protein
MCELTAGYTKPPCASFGGTKSVVVYNTENKLSFVVDPANEVTALTLESGKHGFKIMPDMASIDFTETATRSRENNSIFFASTCSITLKEDTVEVRKLVDLISRGFVTVIQEKENGNNLVYGAINGMTVDTSAITTGLNFEDLNGTVISLVGKETTIAPKIDTTIANSIVA